MRKTVFIILALLSLVSPCLAQELNPGVLGASAAATGTVYTDCSQIGSHAFYWNGDYSGSNVKACKNSTTTITGTMDTTIVDSTSEPGVASPESAGNILDFAANNKYIQWAVSSGDIFSSSEGLATLDIYMTATTGTNIFCIVYVDSNNSIQVYINTNNTVSFIHKGQGSTVSVTSSDTVPDTTWTKLYFRWSVANNKISVKVGSGSWVDDSDADTVTAFAAEPSYVKIGYSTVVNEFYIDNITIDKASGL